MSRIIRYGELWERLKQDLSTAQVLKILGGGQVYIEGENYSKAEGLDGALWGRVVLVPTQTAWPDMDAPGPMTQLSFLVRTEITGDFTPAGYLPGVTLEALQTELYDELVNYCPIDLLYLRIAMPFYIQRLPQPRPLWDNTRRMWFTSSEWRGFVSPVA